MLILFQLDPICCYKYDKPELQQTQVPERLLLLTLITARQVVHPENGCS